MSDDGGRDFSYKLTKPKMTAIAKAYKHNLLFRAKLFNLNSKETLLSRSLSSHTSAQAIWHYQNWGLTRLLQCHVHLGTQIVPWPKPTTQQQYAFWQEMLMIRVSLKGNLKKPCSLKMAMLKQNEIFSTDMYMDNSIKSKEQLQW